MDKTDLIKTICTFSGPETLAYFDKKLNRFLQIPYQELVEGAQSFYEKLERQREYSYRNRKTEFNHLAETRNLVMQFAYAGAMEMKRPYNPLSREEVLVQFINAYNGTKEERNASNRKDNAKVIHVPYDDDKAKKIPCESEPDLFDRTQLREEYLAFLETLSTTETKVLDPLRNNVENGKSHKELARGIRMDPAQFSRVSTRIREKAKSAL